MASDKSSNDTWLRALEQMRRESRSRERRRRYLAEHLALTGIAMFLLLAFLTGAAVWQTLQLPIYYLALFALLAGTMQRTAGLHFAHGVLRMAPRGGRLAWLLIGVCGALLYCA